MAIGAAGGAVAIATTVAPIAIEALMKLVPLIQNSVELIRKSNSGEPLTEADLAKAEQLRRIADAAADNALVPDA